MPDSSHGTDAGTTLTPDFSFDPSRALRYGDYRFVWPTLLRRQPALPINSPAPGHESSATLHESKDKKLEPA